MRHCFAAGSPLHHETETSCLSISKIKPVLTVRCKAWSLSCVLLQVRRFSLFPSSQGKDVRIQVLRAHDPSHSTHQHSHQRATQLVNPAIVGKAARKPPPLPEHFGCCRGHTVTAGDDDTSTDCRTCELPPQLVHRRQWQPARTVCIEGQLLTRRGDSITGFPTSKDCQRSDRRSTRTHRCRGDAYSFQAMLSTASWLHSASCVGAAPAPAWAMVWNSNSSSSELSSSRGSTPKRATAERPLPRRAPPSRPQAPAQRRARGVSHPPVRESLRSMVSQPQISK